MDWGHHSDAPTSKRPTSDSAVWPLWGRGNVNCLTIQRDRRGSLSIIRRPVMCAPCKLSSLRLLEFLARPPADSDGDERVYWHRRLFRNTFLRSSKTQNSVTVLHAGANAGASSCRFPDDWVDGGRQRRNHPLVIATTAFICWVAAVTPLAWLQYQYVERRFIKFGRSLRFDLRAAIQPT